MKKLWLPIGTQSNPYPNPKDRREELLSRLWATRTLLPGARTMELSELESYVDWQEKKMEERARKEEEKPKPSPEEVAQARGYVSEYLRWRRNRMVAQGLVPKTWEWK